MRRISLAHLTCLSLPPPDLIRMAARLGYDHVGLRLVVVTDTTPGYPLMRDAAMLRETRVALAGADLSVLDIEFMRLTPEFDPGAWGGFLDVGAELGARHVITAPYDPDHARLAANLAAFAQEAGKRGLSPLLDFFPWTSVPDLRAAASLVEATGAPGIGILVDALHPDRSGGDPVDLSRVAPARLPLLHLCDAPRHPPYTDAELMRTAREDRLPPGEGAIDLARLLAAMPPDSVVGVEIPMAALERRMGPEHVAARALGATRSLLGAPAQDGR